MTKSIFLSLVMILVSTLGFSTTPESTPESSAAHLTVIATSGLTLRQAPDSKSPVVKIIPFGEVVTLRSDQPDTTFASRVGWVDGQWKVVEHEGDVGFIFDGYLTALPLPDYVAEFSPYGTELLYPLETWALNHHMQSQKPDTIHTPHSSKVVTHFTNGDKLVQSNQHGYYKSELYLHDTRIMDAYNLLQVMIHGDETAHASFTKQSLFVEDFKGDITQVKIKLDDDIEIRKVGPDLVRIQITSVDQFCKL